IRTNRTPDAVDSRTNQHTSSERRAASIVWLGRLRTLVWHRRNVIEQRTGFSCVSHCPSFGYDILWRARGRVGVTRLRDTYCETIRPLVRHLDGSRDLAEGVLYDQAALPDRKTEELEPAVGSAPYLTGVSLDSDGGTGDRRARASVKNASH